MDTAPEQPLQLDQGVADVAKDTGGQFLDRGRLADALSRIASDQSGYYVLSYRAEDLPYDFLAGVPRVTRVALTTPAREARISRPQRRFRRRRRRAQIASSMTTSSTPSNRRLIGERHSRRAHRTCRNRGRLAGYRRSSTSTPANSHIPSRSTAVIVREAGFRPGAIRRDRRVRQGHRAQRGCDRRRTGVSIPPRQGFDYTITFGGAAAWIVSVARRGAGFGQRQARNGAPIPQRRLGRGQVSSCLRSCCTARSRRMRPAPRS